ncbi:MAG: hypothetical protein H6636_09135 [Anaerolineales bacterium]|nr:hypothetical protein [Anaerolineales bacterium]
MKHSKDTTIIVQSLLWAAAIIGAAIILRGTEYAEKIYYLLFMLWFGAFLSLQVSRQSLHEEWRCIRKFLRLSPKTE